MEDNDPANLLIDVGPLEDRAVTIVSGLMILEFLPKEPQDKWGFNYAAEPRIHEKGGLGGRRIRYINTPYFFINEAIIRFESMRPVLKKDGSPYYRFNGEKYIPHVPYSLEAQCGDEWERMAILPTVAFHRQIQNIFAEMDMREHDIQNHLWRVFKGPKGDYEFGKWGIAYHQCDPWEEPDIDPRYPKKDSPWRTIPDAMRVRNEIRDKVLPHFPKKPSADAFIREIMERLPGDYVTAKALYDTRRGVGLP